MQIAVRHLLAKLVGLPTDGNLAPQFVTAGKKEHKLRFEQLLTPADIEQACEEIQAGWSESERASRAAVPNYLLSWYDLHAPSDLRGVCNPAPRPRKIRPSPESYKKDNTWDNIAGSYEDMYEGL